MASDLGEQKSPKDSLFQRQMKVQAAIQQTDSTIDGFKSQLKSLKREGRSYAREVGHEISPGKVKKLKTLSREIKLKNDTINVFQNTLSSQIQQLKKINKEIAKEGKVVEDAESQSDREGGAVGEDGIDWSQFGSDSEKEDNEG